MLPFHYFEQALPYDTFLEQYGSLADRQRWDNRRAAITLTDGQKKLLQSFTRTTNILVVGGTWCGDCGEQCPVLEAFASEAPCLCVRYLDRDEASEAMAELEINGGKRVPVVIFFSEDGYEVARFGERTLASYRRAVSALVDNPWSGLNETDVVSDWLHEVERVQWILRLSPRLRRLHND